LNFIDRDPKSRNSSGTAALLLDYLSKSFKNRAGIHAPALLYNSGSYLKLKTDNLKLSLKLAPHQLN
jgi:hypothetical protein